MNILQQQVEENKVERFDIQDFQCPITYEDYTQENFPVTLPCGHTLSIQAFEKAKESRQACPVCRANIPAGSSPQKNFLLFKVLEQMKANLPANCSNHPQESAIVICTKDKAYLCIDCLREDKCPRENIIPREKLKDYLIKEVAKLNIKEDEALQELDYDAQVNERVFALINPLLSDIVKWELAKSYCSRDLKEKHDLKKGVSNYVPDGQIRILNDIGEQYKKLEDRKTEEEVRERSLQARKIAKKKLMALFEEEPTKIFLDNSLKELNEVQDKDLCESLEVCFKPCFSKQSEFFVKLREFQALESLSLQNLAAFENLGAQDISELANICKELVHVNLDFASTQGCQDLGIWKIFNNLKANQSLKTFQISFKDSNLVSEADLVELNSLIQNSSMRSFTLDLEKCEKVTDAVIKKMFRLNLVGIKELDLSLLHCPQLTGNAMKELIFRLCSQNLQSLALKFGYSKVISCSFLQYMSRYLKEGEISRLSRLTLHFESCPEMKYTGVNHLLSAISHFSSLKELNLTFIDCKELSGVRVFKNLSKCVKKLKGLKCLSFCLKKCPKFNLDGLEKLRKEVKDVLIVDLDCSI